MVSFPDSHSDSHREGFCKEDRAVLTVADPIRHSGKNQLWSRLMWLGAVAAVVFVVPFAGAIPTANAAGPIGQWYSQVEQHLTDSLTAYQTIANFIVSLKDGQEPDPNQLATGCAQLHEANDAMREHTPTPDPQLTSIVNQMIQDADTAAHHCANALQASSQGQFNQEFDAFLKFIPQAYDHFGQLMDYMATLPPSA